MRPLADREGQEFNGSALPVDTQFSCVTRVNLCPLVTHCGRWPLAEQGCHAPSRAFVQAADVLVETLKPFTAVALALIRDTGLDQSLWLNLKQQIEAES